MQKLIFVASVLLLFSCGRSTGTSQLQQSNEPGGERAAQKEVFKVYWQEDLNLVLDELPLEGGTPKERVPYSGYDYPDRAGGTNVKFSKGPTPLQKYDAAFNGGRSLAEAYEKRDTTKVDKPLFGNRARENGLLERLANRRARMRVPAWYGHCNARTAASIRHPEPRQAVIKNGVTFYPADIKALLAELYMYAPYEFLGVSQKENGMMNAGTFHTVLANWVGTKQHPIGFDGSPGEVVINNPIYAYSSTVQPVTTPVSDITNNPEAEEVVYVETRATYSVPLVVESNEPAQRSSSLVFKYYLELAKNSEGKKEIVGGVWARGSAPIDFAWVSLAPVQADGAEVRGNPHISVEEVMALYEESVPSNIARFTNIDR